MGGVSPAVEAFLADRPTATLGTIRRDGSPQASVVWYLWHDGAFTVSTVTWTAKWHNLLRDRRCSVCVDDPESGRMVVAYGDAVLHDGEVRDRTRAIVDRYYADAADTDAHMERIFARDRRVLITVEPHTVVSRRIDDGC